MKSTAWSAGLFVTGDGSGVVAHAGSVAVRLLADRSGPTVALSGAVARRGFVPGHDRGRVLVDVATMITAGGEAIADIETLRHQSDVLGPVASPPTVWRALDELTPAALKRIAAARARTRARVWGLIPGGLPASAVAGATLAADLVVLDVDATIVIAHRREGAGRGHVQEDVRVPPDRRLGINTQELLAASLRPGNAGSNTTADHIDVLTAAIAQVPAAHQPSVADRRDDRRRPDRLAAAHRATASTEGLRTQSVAVPVPACPGPADQGRPPTSPAAARDVALGHRGRGHVHQSDGPPDAHLTLGHVPDRPPPGPPETRTAAPRGPLPCPEPRTPPTSPAATVTPSSLRSRERGRLGQDKSGRTVHP